MRYGVNTEIPNNHHDQPSVLFSGLRMVASWARHQSRPVISARPAANLPDLRLSGSAGCTARQVARGHGRLREPDTDAHDLLGRDLLLFEPGATGLKYALYALPSCI
ncbi:MAG: hypothetical protein ACYDHX_04370 [Methanothrix sp.]